MYFPEVKILLVEDNESDQISIQCTLKKLNPEVQIHLAASLNEATQVLGNELFDVILLDYFIKEENGLDLLPQVPDDIPIIFISGHGDQNVISNALGEGAFGYLLKDMELSYLNLLGPTIQNVIERKNVEKKLQQHMLELERSNRELFAFAKNVSIGLKDPLTKLRVYQEEVFQAIDSDQENLKHFFSLAEKSIQKIEFKINSLFEYSQLNCQQEMIVEVDLNNLLMDISDSLKEEFQKNQVELNIQPLPTISGNPFLLRRMFENIIQNSLHFRKQDQHPRIFISKGIENGFSSIEIIDNGIGFDEADKERIFDPFERLNPDSPGIGMGLATCKQIANLHGGKIFAESKPNEGTTIKIKFPTHLSR